MKLPFTTIEKIANELTSFEVCYLHKKTLEVIITISDEYDRRDFLEEIYEHGDENEKAIYKDIETNPTNYYIIEPMNSSESYRIMEDFVEQVSDEKIKEKLEQAINGKSPFANFKHIMKQEISEEWYEYENKRSLEWMANKIRLLGIEIN